MKQDSPLSKYPALSNEDVKKICNDIFEGHIAITETSENVGVKRVDPLDPEFNLPTKEINPCQKK